MPGQFGFELSPEDIASASDKTQQQVSPSFSSMAGELAPVPWWKRKLRQMQEGNPAQAAGQAAQGGGSDPVDSWESLGKGVGNLARMFIPMEQGGVVQGPTPVLAGEAGEAEAFVPESKALPFALETLRTGKMPNPANLPRVGEHRPPPPVILGNTPAMGCGGKVVPKMMNGGKVIPTYGRPVQSVMEESTDFFNIGQPMPEASFAPDMQAPPPMMARPGALPSSPNITPSFEQRKRLQQLIAQGAPAPKFYDRLFMGEGNGPMDMRPGVAPYSVAGRAAGKIIGSLLPYNKKRDEYQRQIEAAKVGSQLEEAQSAAAIRQQELEQRGRVADSQVASNKATEAYRNRQLSDMDKPTARKLRVTDYTNAETGDVTRVWNDENTGDEVKREVLGGVAKPKPTATSERNPTAASLAATAADPNATPEQRAAAEKALKLLKPPKTGGKDKSGELLTPNESMTLGVPYGTTRKQAFGADPKKPLAESAMKQIASARSAVGSLEDLKAALKENEQYIGPIAGIQALNPYSDARKAQAKIDLVKQRVGKTLEGGVLRKEDEEKYKKILATLTDTPATAISKVDGLIAEINRDIQLFEDEQRRGGRRVPSAGNPNPGNTQPTPPFPGAVLMQAPNVKDPVWVAPDKVESAIKKGAKRI